MNNLTPNETAPRPATVSIVMGDVGEYSDRSVWIVGVWSRQEDAEAFVAEMDRLGDAYRSAEHEDFLSKETDAACAACVAADPKWDMWADTLPKYSIKTETVR